MLKLYLSLCSGFIFRLWQHCAKGLVGLRHKTTWLGSREIMFWITWVCRHKQSWKLLWPLTRNILFCCHENGWKKNTWFFSWSGLKNWCLALQSSALTLPPPDKSVSSFTCNLNVIWNVSLKWWYDAWETYKLNMSMVGRNVESQQGWHSRSYLGPTEVLLAKCRLLKYQKSKHS